MKRGQKHAVRHPWLSIQLCKGFILQIINCYSVVGETDRHLCGFFIVLHLLLLMLAYPCWHGHLDVALTPLCLAATLIASVVWGRGFSGVDVGVNGSVVRGEGLKCFSRMLLHVLDKTIKLDYR